MRPYFLSTETNKLQLLEDVKALQREITLLEEMKKAHTEKSQSTTMRTAVDAVCHLDIYGMLEVTDDDGRGS